MPHRVGREAALPEHIEMIEDPVSGLRGAIVIHSTRLGPAAGGCRLWHYSNDNALLNDALRLAEGMSYKNAMAGLPLGGGKAVLQRPAGDFDRAALFQAFGRAVQRLEGTYITAEDVGSSVADMTAASSETAYVAGLASMGDRPGGDPSPWTARGVFVAMQAAVQRRSGGSLDGATVAVQGLGSVGNALCSLLHGAGARLIVTDPRTEAVRAAEGKWSAKAVALDDILDAKADIFAPCALGGVLDGHAIARLRVKLVCGAANNQLADSGADGLRLTRRRIDYAPDFVVNAGGIINVAAEYLNWTGAEVQDRVAAIAGRLVAVLDQADAHHIPPAEMAHRLAKDAIAIGTPVDREAIHA
ncbi:MAG: Glu/Leu/Phe/Val dehydrogenase dimerization domain-containing protein [Pseudomonadota bacterium]